MNNKVVERSQASEFNPDSQHEFNYDSVDVLAGISSLLRNKWKTLTILSLALVVAWFQLSITISEYTARAEIVIDGQQAPVDLGELLGPDGGAADKELQTQLLVVRSRPLLAKVIEDLGLMGDIEFNPTAGLAPQPVWAGWLEQFSLWPISVDTSQFPPDVKIGIALESPVMRRDEQMLRIAIDRLKEKVKTGIMDGTTVLWVTTSSWTPEKSASITNAIAAGYIDERRRARVQAQRDASEFISEQVVELRDEVETAEAAIQAFRSENSVIDQSDGSVLEYERIRNRAEIAETLEVSLTDRLERFERTLASGEGIRAASRILEDSSLNALANAGLDVELQREADVVVTQLRTDLRLTRARARALKESLIETRVSLESAGENLVRLRQLEREAEASKLLLETFLARQKETAAQQQLISADARVLNQALPPYDRSWPSALRYYLIALTIGLLLAVGLIYLQERTRNRFVTADELEEWSGYTVLGSVPKMPKIRGRTQILRRVQKNAGGALAEAVRNLRTSILLANIDCQSRRKSGQYRGVKLAS